jgi:hypothetical protein
MNFLDYDHSFCEATLYGKAPEYINAFTSLFISLVGLIGIKYNHHHIYDIYILYSALLLNGIFSFGYHWTNNIGFGHLDRYTMILIAYASISGGLKEIHYLYKLSNKSYKTAIFLQQTYITILMVLCALKYLEIFNALFGIFLGLILVFIKLVDNKKSELNYKIINTIKYAWYGICMISFAGISWIIIEKLCNTFNIMKYLHGHAFWHIFVSFGGYLTSLLIVNLALERKKILPKYNFHNLVFKKNIN